MVDYRIFDRDKFTVVGSPIITDDGVASGLSSSNYITVPFSISSNQDFNIKCRFTYGSNTTTSQNLFELKPLDSSLDTGNWRPMSIRPVSGTRFYVVYSPSATTNASFPFSESEVPLVQGATYDFELDVKGSTMNITVNGVTKTRTDLYRYDITTSPFGLSRLLSGPFLGSIDLKQFSITVDGVEVFSGSHLANTAEKLQYLRDSKEIIRQSIEAKGVEVPVETPFRSYADKIGEISGGGGNKKQRFLKIGSPTDNNGIFTDLNSENYLLIPFSGFVEATDNRPRYARHEFNIGFKTGTDFNSKYYIISGQQTSSSSYRGIYLNTTGNICYSYDTKDWCVSDDILKLNTNYILKILKHSNTSTNSGFYYIEDTGYNIDNLPDLSNWQRVPCTNNSYFFGSCYQLHIGRLNPVPSVNMNKCNYIMDNIEIWRAIS